MLYREILEQAPHDYLQLIAFENGIRRDISDEALRLALAERLADGDTIRRTYGSFDEQTRAILRFLVFSSEDGGIQQPLVHSKLDHLTESWDQDAHYLLHRLVRRGFVVTTSVDQYNLYYVMPEEVRQHLMPLHSKEVRCALGPQDEPPSQFRHDGGAFLRDLYIFLSSMRSDPPKLTQAGHVYKRFQQRLGKMLEVPEGPPGYEGEGDDAFTRIDWLHRFAVSEDLAEADNGVLRTTPLVSDWLQGSERDRQRALYDFWWEQQRYLFTYVALRILKTLGSDEWIALAALHQQMQHLSPEPLWRLTLHEHLFQTMLNPLIYFGLLKYSPEESLLCVTPLGHRLFHRLPAEDTEAVSFSLVVQPNYEVLVERELDLSIRWQLDRFAQLEKADQMITYRISQESVYQAMKSGMDCEDMLDFMRRYSRTGVPQNVEYAVEEWAGHYGRLEFVDAMLLRCKDAQLAREIRANPKFRRHVLGNLTPTNLIVNRASQKHLASLLEQAGYMPKPEIRRISESSDDGDSGTS